MQTGIPKLDEALGGGIPYGSIILVETDGLANFKPLYAAILRRAVKEEEACLTYVLSSRETPLHVAEMFRRYGLDVEKLIKQERFNFVDYYERFLAMRGEEGIAVCPEKSDSEGLVKVFERAL